jgi:hypothetical protein
MKKGWDTVENFRFTAFEKTGEILFDEVWKFENEEDAKVNGQLKIKELGVQEKTHRLVNSAGKLILFHV